MYTDTDTGPFHDSTSSTSLWKRPGVVCVTSVMSTSSGSYAPLRMNATLFSGTLASPVSHGYSAACPFCAPAPGGSAEAEEPPSACEPKTTSRITTRTANRMVRHTKPITRSSVLHMSCCGGCFLMGVNVGCAGLEGLLADFLVCSTGPPAAAEPACSALPATGSSVVPRLAINERIK